MEEKPNVSRDTAPVATGFDFPTEVIELPSKGVLYDKSSPLSKGQVDIKYMTAREEEILSSESLIKKGIVLDRLLESVLVTPGINLNDLLIGDKNAIMMAARVMGYGKGYDVQIICPSCNNPFDRTINLEEIKTKEVDLKALTNTKTFEFECPTTKDKLTFKLLTHGNEVDIEAEVKTLARLSKKDDIDHEFTTRLRYIITSVNGKTDKESITTFINNNFLARDIKKFRKHISSISPDIDMKYNFICDEGCPRGGDEFGREVSVPMGVGFFWPEF